MKKPTAKRFGALSVDMGFITGDQLKRALRIQAREDAELNRHRLIGQILVSQGWLSEAQVGDILNAMSHNMVMAPGLKHSTAKRFGTVAMEKGFITGDQLEKALRIQALEDAELNRHRLIGQILVSQGWLTEAQVEDILDTMSQKLVMTIGLGR